MRIFGLEIKKAPANLTPPLTRDSGLWGLVRESFTGAWQRNVEVTTETALMDVVVFSCITSIAGDIAKCWLKLVQKDENGISTEVENPAYSPVLRTPNHYQTRNKFVEYWFLCKLIYGNTYVLKERDQRGVVNAMHILDPNRVKVLQAPDGSVFYQLESDYLAGLEEDKLLVPASEIIHDLGYPLHHPLVGVSPIRVAMATAGHRLTMQSNSTRFFANGSQPSGVVMLQTPLSADQVKLAQRNWEEQFAGPHNSGKVAFLTGGATYEPLALTNVEAQMIDQEKWSVQMIAMAYKIPPYILGIGPAPPYTDLQSIQLEYHNRALHPLIEQFEEVLSRGLELKKPFSVEVDTKALLRMDTKTQVDNATKGILGGLWKPNEARADFDLKPVEGGDTVYLQQQNFSLSALNKRDQQAPAPATDQPASLKSIALDLAEAVLIAGTAPRKALSAGDLTDAEIVTEARRIAAQEWAA